MKKTELNKKVLLKLYSVEKLSVRDIGIRYSLSPRTISRKLKKFSIEARPFSTKGLQPRLGAILTEETKQKISLSHLGKKIPQEVRIKMGSKLEKNSAWKGGVTPINKRIRNSSNYKFWKESIFKRDDFRCQKCLKRGGTLNAHHVKHFSEFPELRFALDNGITLCRKCHMQEHTV